MKTLLVAVPDVKYACSGELPKLVEAERLGHILDKCVEEAEGSGFPVMTMDEINAEIKAYRAEKRATRNAESNY
ncbi:hypothetical protein R83H12_02275 [Fibrobacteria bacterium R8-3-H12]